MQGCQISTLVSLSLTLEASTIITKGLLSFSPSYFCVSITTFFLASTIMKRSKMTTIGAYLFAGLAFVVVVFQSLLALGVPWGKLMWGGRYAGQLAGAMRTIAVLSILLVAFFALITLSRTGLVLLGLNSASRIIIWIVISYCAIGSVANSITPSRWERTLWLPVTRLMLLSSIVVAIG